MKTTSSRLARALEQSKAGHSYWTERIKLKFAVALEKRRRTLGMSYTDVATGIGASPAYITKVFRGDSNLTIETMVKLARATGCELDIQLVAAEKPARVWSPAQLAMAHQSAMQTAILALASTVTQGNYAAANHGQYKLGQAA